MSDQIINLVDLFVDLIVPDLNDNLANFTLSCILEKFLYAWLCLDKIIYLRDLASFLEISLFILCECVWIK